MESDDGFEAFGREIESDPIFVLLAKWQRDVFISKLQRLPDVVEVIETGSLARGTQIGLGGDVDLIVVYDKSKHPEFDQGEESVGVAMRHLKAGLTEQIHPILGGESALFNETRQRTHVVRWQSISAGPFAEFIPTPPPVDVMPAIRRGSHLRAPKVGNGWIDVDPQSFMRQIEQRQREWKYFKEVIKMVKAWAEENGLHLRNLAIDVMVLKYCPRPGLFESLSCGEAVARFFENASSALFLNISDPAGWCGPIGLGGSYLKLRIALSEAAGLARKAMNAEHDWENRFSATSEVTNPDVFWRELFGSKYPNPKERFYRPSASEPWFVRRPAERAEAPIFGDPPHMTPDPPRPPRPPRPPKDGPDPRGPGGPGPRDPDDPWRGPSGGGPRNPDDSWRGPTGGGGRPFDEGPEGPSHTGPGRETPRPHPAEPNRNPEPASADAGTDVWTEVFGATVTAAVPLTFG